MSPKQYGYFSCILVLMALLALGAPLGVNLEYEYALALSWLFLICLPLMAFIPRLRPFSAPHAGGILRDFIVMAVLFPLLFSLPGMVLLATRTCRCASSEFGAFQLIQVIPSYYLALSLFYGVAFGIVRHKLRRRMIFAALLALYVGVILFIGIQLYIHPQKRFLSLIFGYLHGPIYDGWLPIDGGLVLGRLLAVATALIIFSLVTLRLKSSRILFLMASVMLFGFISYRLTRHPSVLNGKSYLDQQLPDTLRAHDFVIHYRRGPIPLAIPADMRRLYREVQFHLAELGAYFSSHFPPIQIYIYPDNTTRKLLFGASETDVTDIFTPSVHLVRDMNAYPSLRHELVHAISSPSAYHGLGFHPNMAFTEGLAMALAPQEQPVSLDNGAAAILLAGRMGDMADLLGTGFYKISADRAYTLAGSFIQFLIGEYGFAGVLKIYSGASFEQVIPEERMRVTGRWRERIVAGYDRSEDILTEAMYRYSGIFHDVCPHSKVTLAKDRNYGKIVRLRQPVGWNPDVDYWLWRAELEPADLDARMMLWKKELKKMAVMRNPPHGRLITFYEKIKSLTHQPPQSIEDFELALLASDILSLEGNRAESSSLLHDFSRFGESSFPGYDMLRQIDARLLVDTQLPPGRAFEYRKYLAGWNVKPLGRFGATDSFIGRYLYLRSRESANMNEESLRRYLNTPPDTTISRALALAWYKTLGQRLMAAGAYLDAYGAFGSALTYASSGMRPILQQYQRQARFLQKNIAFNAGALPSQVQHPGF